MHTLGMNVRIGTLLLLGLLALHLPGDAVADGTTRLSLAGSVEARDGIWGLRYSPDGRSLAGIDGSGTLTVWDATRRSVRKRLDLANEIGKGLCVAFSPDGNRLAVAGSLDQIVLVDPHTLGVQDVVSTETSDIWGLAFAGNGMLVSMHSDGKVLRTNLPVLSGRGTQTGGSGERTWWDRTRDDWSWGRDARVAELAKLPTRSHSDVVAFGEGADARIWVAGMGGRAATTEVMGSGGFGRAFDDHNGGARAVAGSPDGRFLATGGWDDQLVIRDLRSTGEPRRIRIDSDGNGLAFFPDGTRVVVGTDRGTLMVVDTSDGTIHASIERAHPDGWLSAVAVSPDGREIAAGGYGSKVELWTIAQPSTAPGVNWTSRRGARTQDGPTGLQLFGGD